MAHHNHCECTNTGLDLFTVPPLQTSVEDGHTVEYHPMATIMDSGPIEFTVKGDTDSYIDLANSYIHTKVRVVRPDNEYMKAADDGLVCPVNLLLQNMFCEVDVYLNGTLVSSSTNTYAHRAYLETLLNYGRDAKVTQLANAGYVKKGTPQFTYSKTSDNAGVKIRRSMIHRSRVVDLVGRIHADIFAQEKYLLNGVDLRLRFVRNKDAFSLMAVPENDGEAITPYKIKVEHMSLFVRKAKVNPAIVLAHAKVLQSTTAKYPIKRVVTKVFSAPQGVMNFVKDNLYLSQKPQKLIIGFVKSSAFNGDYSADPYEFQHLNINSFALFSDGQQIPNKALRPDFPKMTYARSYLSLFTGTGLSWKDVGNDIAYSEYRQGYSLFCFDLSPSLVDGTVTEPAKSGNLRLEVGFGFPLPYPVHVIVYGELDGMIEIDRARQVITDFAS